jgi:hypothetical protein
MGTEDIRELVDGYFAWLRDKTTLKAVDENWTEITTPLLDRHNDYLQIYVRRENGQYVLSDDGYILADLEQCGCSLDTPRRQSLLSVTLNGFGVKLEKGNLLAHASREDFGRRKHNLLQAMLAVNDLFSLASPFVASLFFEDVIEWLDLHEVRYTRNKKVTGKSGFDHLFHFIIPKSRTYPERFVQAVTTPDRSATQKLFGTWVDVQGAVGDDAMGVAILNDSEHRIGAGVPDALRSYGIQPVLWSARDRALKMLAA